MLFDYLLEAVKPATSNTTQPKTDENENDKPPTDYGAMKDDDTKGDNDSGPLGSPVQDTPDSTPGGASDTTTGGGTDSPGSGDHWDEPPTDYGAMNQDNDDTPGGSDSTPGGASDNPGNTTAGGGTDSPGSGDHWDEPPTDYGAMGQDDNTTGGDTPPDTGDTAGGDTPGGDTGDPNNEPPTDYGSMDQDQSDPETTDYSGMSGGDPNEEPPTDYGAMADDDASGGDTDETSTGQDASTGDTGDAGGDAGTGDSSDDSGSHWDEPPTDYGAVSDPDNPNQDSASGGDGSTGDTNDGDAQDGTSTDQASGTDDTGAQGNDPTQELRDLEAKLFSDLSPTQVQIKDNELKTQYINLYEDIDSTIVRVNRIVKTDNNQEIVAFLSRKLDELKDMVYNSLVETYQTQTYMQNLMLYNTLLANYASIGQMLLELSKKDPANNDTEDKTDKEDEIDDEVVSSTMDDNGV